MLTTNYNARYKYKKHYRKIDGGVIGFFFACIFLITSSFMLIHSLTKSRLIVITISEYIDKLIKNQPFNPILRLLDKNKALFSALDNVSEIAYTKFTRIVAGLFAALMALIVLAVILKLYLIHLDKKSKDDTTIIKKRMDFLVLPLVFFAIVALVGLALIIPILVVVPKSLIELVNSNILNKLSTKNNAMVEILRGFVSATFKDNDILEKATDKTRITLLVVTVVSFAICVVIVLCYIFFYNSNEKNEDLKQNSDELDVVEHQCYNTKVKDDKTKVTADESLSKSR